jgi:hypothetical protein
MIHNPETPTHQPSRSQLTTLSEQRPRSSIKVLSLSQKQGATAINRFGLDIHFFVVMLETRSESVARRRECLASRHAPIVSKEDEGGES